MRKVKSWMNKFNSVVNLKENVEIVGRLGASHLSARIVQTTMMEIMDTEPEQILLIRKIRLKSMNYVRN
jgi:hypothetical protein